MKIHGEAVELGQNPGFHHEKMGGSMNKNRGLTWFNVV